MTSDILILCSTARLARSLRLAHDRHQKAKGLRQWQPLNVLTLSQWLETTVEQAWLSGECDAATVPGNVLTPLQERILWENIISEALADEEASSLFDVTGMAQAAMEAHALVTEWQLDIPSTLQTEESRHFLAWQAEFLKHCKTRNWMDTTRHMAWQLNVLQTGAGILPAAIEMAGFDRLSPLVMRLIDILKSRGIQVGRFQTGLSEPGRAQQVCFESQEQECRAAVAWAAAALEKTPHIRLGIIVPELAKLRQTMASLLDDALHPGLLRPAFSEGARSYDFSLGLPLTAQAMIGTALQLLRMVFQYRLSQEEVSALLLQPYWSASLSEADGRARLDARMREWLPLTVSMRRLVRLMTRLADADNGLPINNLLAHMQGTLVIKDTQPNRQMPAQWAVTFQVLLDAFEWPGERSLSSHEYQARNAFTKTLQALGKLDVLGQPLTAMQALQRLNELCRDQIFQPEAEGNPRLLIMGMLEGTEAPLDGLWVMGMNDHVWPPPPRPNPLLPAIVQRKAGVPNADSTIQAEFARAIHQRILHGAQEIVFSWAAKDGERPLRASPVLFDIPITTETQYPQAATLAEILAAQGNGLIFEDDHMAPPVLEGERVTGGTGLLKAQAICPAWAYYQYRLGARALKEPVNGLEASERGTLVHGVLQHFWQGRSFVDLQAMDEVGLKTAVSTAVDAALSDFNVQRDEAMPDDFNVLEQARLIKLVSAWLTYEKTREVDFRVEACELEKTLTIEGIEIKLVIDRIDQLADGKRVVMDYKTGQKPDIRNWAQERITEPQLPIYAAFTLDDGEAAAICFAMVRTDEHAFAGIAADAILPGVPPLEDKKARAIFALETFADWQALQAHWRTSLQAIAREIKSGEAAVRFIDEQQLAYCEVLPLLRLPERHLQYERLQMAGQPELRETAPHHAWN